MSLVLMIVLILALAVPALASESFTLTSPDIREGDTLPEDHVFNGSGCSGKNVSPRLEWRNPPAGTQSFAVTAYDPDAPTGSGWWHWVVFNIPASARVLERNAGGEPALLPEGAVESVTDFGQPGYGGACPPVGDAPHRYIFTVYALKTSKLDLAPETLPAMVGFNIHPNILAKATLTVTYGR